MEEKRSLVLWLSVIVPIAVLIFAGYTVNVVKNTAIESANAAIKGIGPFFAPLPTPRVDIALYLDASGACTADPWSPDIQLGSKVVFSNGVGTDIYVEFLNPGIIQGGVSEIFIEDGEKGDVDIVHHTHASLPLTLEYIIKDEEKKECSVKGNRPRIIIQPPSP